MRPSDSYKIAALSLSQALKIIALAARASGDLDRAALEYAVAAMDAAQQWTKDSTEAARRRASCNASACQALAAAPVAGRGSLTRQALAGFGAAVLALMECKAADAMAAAEAAQMRLYA
jgi:hypothetical protein